MNEEQLTLAQKLAEIRKMTEAITKNKAGYNYKYVTVDEILARVTAGMKKFGVSLTPNIRPGTGSYQIWEYGKTKFTKSGQQYEEKNNEIIFSAEVIYRWTDLESGEVLDVPWYIAGSQADPAQALGSAMTYGLRQFLMNFFQIAALDNEDPDSFRSKQKAAEEQEQREVAKQIVEEIHRMVTEHLEKSPDDRNKVITITKKYAVEKGKPSPNYYAITDPDKASKLMEELKGLFMGNTEKKEQKK